MNKNNIKEIKGKTIALSQIFILMVSIFTFAYFVGDEFKFVEAVEEEEEIMGIVPAPSAPSATSIPVSPSATTLAKEALLAPQIPVTTGAEYQQATFAEKAAYLAEQDAILAKKAEILTGLGTHVVVAVANAGIAIAFYFGGKALGEVFFGTGSPVAEQLGQALAWGYGIGAGIGMLIELIPGGAASSIGFLSSSLGFSVPLLGTPIIGLAGGLIGLGVAGVIWFFTATNERIDTVQFTCSPWQPKTKGEDCGKCNNGQLPCTEYKCKSLGNCEFIVNEKTGEDVCVWDDRNDIAAPIISSWAEPLKENFSYTPATASLPAESTGTSGVTLRYTGEGSDVNGCLSPFKIVPFGISLNKPGKCKMDLVRKDKFTDMSKYISFGESIYNHTLYAFSPGLDAAEKEGITIPNGGNYEVYVRCESRNEVSNVGTFVFKFCAQEHDGTAPIIPLTEPLNGMPISMGTNSQEVKFYTDKPADCKWSHSDESYDRMTGTMIAETDNSEGLQSIADMGSNMLYKHTTTLDGLKDEVENKFYVKCKSYPLNDEADRVTNEESYIYKLLGTRALIIDSVEPLKDSTIKDSTEIVKVTLGARTSAGHKDGESWCKYNETSNPTSGDYVLFASDTSSTYQHSQDLWLEPGNYQYSIKCCDLGGNCKTDSTKFDVETDSTAPIVTRVYKSVDGLNIATNEKSECVYSISSQFECSYTFEDGIKLTTTDNINHYTEWSTDSIFFVKCKDEFGRGPVSGKCSVIARPFSSI